MLRVFLIPIARKAADAYNLAIESGNWWGFKTNPYVILWIPFFIVGVIGVLVLLSSSIDNIKYQFFLKDYEKKLKERKKI